MLAMLEIVGYNFKNLTSGSESPNMISKEDACEESSNGCDREFIFEVCHMQGGVGEPAINKSKR